MGSPARVWIGLAVLYAAFFAWYTSFSGPLSPEEIDHYVARLAESGGDPQRLAVFRRFMEGDTGDDFAMVNVIEMRERPLEVAGVEVGDTSAEVLERYTRPFLRQAFRDAAHPILLGAAASEAVDLWGLPGARAWTTAGVVRYRSRRDLVEQALRALDADIHGFKVAAMEKTIAFPIDPWFQLGDPRLVLGLILAPIGLGWHLRSALVRLRAAEARAAAAASASA
jgi:hypothetical protein